MFVYGRRTASEEGVELDQQLDVRVIALSHLSVRLLDVVLVETDREKLAFIEHGASVLESR